MRLQALLLVSLVMPFLPRSGSAQITPMTPTPSHEALAYFEGVWTTEETPPDQQFVETCAWMNAGRRQVADGAWKVDATVNYRAIK